MIRRADEPLSDSEYPDDIDLADSDGDDSTSVVAKCPNCGFAIWEESSYCQHCRQWITFSEDSWRNSKKIYIRFGLWGAKTLLLNWIFWGALLAIINLAWLMRYLFFSLQT